MAVLGIDDFAGSILPDTPSTNIYIVSSAHSATDLLSTVQAYYVLERLDSDARGGYLDQGLARGAPGPRKWRGSS